MIEMKNNTNNNKTAKTQTRLITNIPTEHINLALSRAAEKGVYSFNAYVRNLIAQDVDRRRTSR